MQEMTFRGNLKDFLDSKKLDILKLIRFGIISESDLLNDFQITMPAVNFNNPVDIIRIDDDKWNQTIYVLKFAITGDTTVLDYKPSTSFITMPEWVIKNQEIWFRMEESDLETMKIQIDGIIETFKSHLSDVNADVIVYNTTLGTDIQKLISSHSNRINDKNKNLEEIRNHLLFRD